MANEETKVEVAEQPGENTEEARDDAPKDFGGAKDALMTLMKDESGSAETPMSDEPESGEKPDDAADGESTVDEPEEGESTTDGGEDRESKISRLLDEVGGLETEATEEAVEDGEDIPEFDEEAFMEQFSENPAVAIKSLVEAAKADAERSILEELAPALSMANREQQREAVTKVFADYFQDPGNEDAENYMDGIREYLEESGLPLDDPRSLKEAHMASKLKDFEGRKSLEDYMSDEEAVNSMMENEEFMGKLMSNPALLKRIMASDDIKSGVIGDYIKELEDGKKPVTIAQEGSAAPSALPPKVNKNLKDAKAAVLRDLSR
jgi:hypothetical protein